MEHFTCPWSAGWAFCLVAPIRALLLIQAGAPGWLCPSDLGLAPSISARACLATAHAGTPFLSMKEQTCAYVYGQDRGELGAYCRMKNARQINR